MPTRDFIESVRERAQSDPDFGKALLREAMSCMLNGEPKIGRLLLHDYADAVIGFDDLSRKTGKRPKDLERMLSRDGDPSAGDLLGVIAAIAKHEGIELDVPVTQRSHAEEPLAA